MGFGPGSADADLRHQGEDIPEVSGLEPGALHHLQEQDRRGLSQGLRSLQDDLIVGHMAEPNPREL